MLILAFLSLLILLISFVPTKKIEVEGQFPASYTNMVGHVPYFRQVGDTCGLYSMQEVLMWFGVEVDFGGGPRYVTAADIGDFLGKDEGPHYLWELDEAFEHFMPEGSWHTYGGFDDAEEAKDWVKSCIVQDIPVICCIQAPGSFTLGWANHYVAIVGYDDIRGGGGWYLQDPGGWTELANENSWDSFCGYDWFDNYWDKWWTASLGGNDNRGVVAAMKSQGVNGLALPEVSLRTEGSAQLESSGIPIVVELKNDGTDNSWHQRSPANLERDFEVVDGVGINVSKFEITGVNLGDFQRVITGSGESGEEWDDEWGPTQSVFLEYLGGTAPGEIVTAEVFVQPTANYYEGYINAWGYLTDEDNWIRVPSFVDDDSTRTYSVIPNDGIRYGVEALLPERISSYCDNEIFLTVDTTPPGTPSPDDGVSGWSSDNTPTFSWGAVSDSLSGVDGYYWRVDSGSSTWTTGTSVTVSAVSDGSHTFYVRAKDNAGNYGSWGSHTFQIDNTAPSAPTVSSSTHPNQDAWYSNNDPSVSWAVPTDTSGIAGYSIGISPYSFAVPDEIVDTNDNTFSYMDVEDGEWYFHVRARDNAGNWGSDANYRIRINASSSMMVTLYFDVSFEDEVYVVETCSNSSVTDLVFNQSAKRIMFSVEGSDGTVGVCDVTFPADLLSGGFTVFIDDMQLVEGVDYTLAFNGTHNTISVSYVHSSHVVEVFATEVVPDFAAWLLLPFLVSATLLGLALRRKLKKQSTI